MSRISPSESARSRITRANPHSPRKRALSLIHIYKTAEVPNLFRFGMTLTMPARYDRVVYYGRGAHENYADRLSSADLGLYEQRVADQYHDEYVRPQESGTKGGLRWCCLLYTSRCV